MTPAQSPEPWTTPLLAELSVSMDTASLVGSSTDGQDGTLTDVKG